MHKSAVLTSYPMRFTLIFIALVAASPVTFILAGSYSTPFFILMAALFLSVCIMPLLDFEQFKRAILLRFFLRIALSAVIGFIIFRDEMFVGSLILAVYSMVLLSTLTFVLSYSKGHVSVFCLVLFALNFGIGFINYRTDTFGENEQFLNILLIISFIALFSYFVVQGIDESRWFGVDCLKIPRAMQRAAIVLVAVVSVLFLIVSSAGWIARGVEGFFAVVANLLSRLNEFIFNFISSLFRETSPSPLLPVEPMLPPELIQPYVPHQESMVQIVLSWVTLIIFALILIVLFSITLFKLVKSIIQIFKAKHREVWHISEVYEEVIEKITASENKRAKPRNFFSSQRYSSLRSDRERILFIYKEYVKRAKRKGFTHDKASATPNEILYEVSKNIGAEKFPYPENLESAFNTARYSDDYDTILGADELKHRLL